MLCFEGRGIMIGTFFFVSIFAEAVNVFSERVSGSLSNPGV